MTLEIMIENRKIILFHKIIHYIVYNRNYLIICYFHLSHIPQVPPRLWQCWQAEQLLQALQGEAPTHLLHSVSL